MPTPKVVNGDLVAFGPKAVLFGCRPKEDKAALSNADGLYRITAVSEVPSDYVGSLIYAGIILLETGILNALDLHWVLCEPVEPSPGGYPAYFALSNAIVGATKP